MLLELILSLKIFWSWARLKCETQWNLETNFGGYFTASPCNGIRWAVVRFVGQVFHKGLSSVLPAKQNALHSLRQLSGRSKPWAFKENNILASPIETPDYSVLQVLYFMPEILFWMLIAGIYLPWYFQLNSRARMYGSCAMCLPRQSNMF